MTMTFSLSPFLHTGRKNGENDKNYDTLDLPKRTEPSKGRCLSGKLSENIPEQMMSEILFRRKFDKDR